MDPDKRATAEECLQHPWLNMSPSDRVLPPRPRLPLPKKEKVDEMKGGGGYESNSDDNKNEGAMYHHHLADAKYDSDDDYNHGDGENLDDDLDDEEDDEDDEVEYDHLKEESKMRK